MNVKKFSAIFVCVQLLGVLCFSGASVNGVRGILLFAALVFLMPGSLVAGFVARFIGPEPLGLLVTVLAAILVNALSWYGTRVLVLKLSHRASR